ncbi:MAG: YtxH domain-containing protein [SAR202 cluster bacterium]|nr:YtxH domain-containing protein [SAR202 cluster bacterium]
MLMAPKSGKDTRQELMDRGDKLRHQAEEMAASLKEKVGPKVENVREQVNERVAPLAGRISNRGKSADGANGEQS